MTVSELAEDEFNAKEFLEIKERKLKNLYEKFCFLNHMTENML